MVAMVGSDGNASGPMTGCKHGKISTGKSEVGKSNALITGFVGPILYRCQTVLKTQIEMGDFGIGAAYKYIFTGYISRCCCQHVNQKGTCE